MLKTSCLEFRHRKKSVVALGIGIAFSVFLVIFLSLFAASYMKSYEENRKNEYGEFSVLTGAIMDDASFAEIYHDELWTKKGVSYLMGVATSEQGNRDFHLGYMDEGAIELSRSVLLAGRYPKKPGEIALEEGTANRMGLSKAWKPGDKVTFDIIMDDETDKRTYEVTGILSNTSARFTEFFVNRFGDTNGTFSFYPIDCLLSYEEVRECVLARNLMLYSDCFDSERLFANMGAVEFMGNSYAYPQIYKNKDYVSVRMERTLPVVILILSGISILFITFLVSASIEKRRRQLALFRSLGATKGQAFFYIVAEGICVSVFFALLGLLVGVPLSIGTIRLLEEPFYNFTRYELYVDWKPWIAIAATLGAMLVAILAYTLPAFTVLRIPPIQEAARSGITKRRRSLRRRKTDSINKMIRNSIQQTMGRKVLYVAGFVLCLSVIHAISVYNRYNLQEESGYRYGDFCVININSGISWTNEESEDFQVDGMENGDASEDFDKKVVRELDGRCDYMIRMASPLFLAVYPKEKYTDYIRYLSGWEFLKWGDSPENPNNVMSMFGDVCIYDERALETLEDKVMEGEINPEAIRNGEEIILCMPPYSAIINQDDYPMRTYYDYFKEWVVPNTNFRGENDAFHAGDTIDLRVRDSKTAEPVIKSVTIGAIVNAETGFVPIVTEEGLEKLGMPYHWKTIRIFLRQDSDMDDIKAQLEQYTDSYEIVIESNLEAAAISKKNQKMVNLLGSLLILLFIGISVSLLLQSTYVRFQNAQKEMAMLRAVGMTKNQAANILIREALTLSVVIAVVYLAVNAVWTRMIFVYEWYAYFNLPMNVAAIVGMIGLMTLTTYAGVRAFLKDGDMISTIQG